MGFKTGPLSKDVTYNANTPNVLKNTKQAIFNGRVLKNHFIDNNGTIYTVKQNGNVYKRKHTECDYPFFGYDCPVSNKNINIRFHRIICETFYETPIPSGVTENEWKVTPKSIKNLMLSNFWQVNHIDNNPRNYHPSNLEWVSRSENIEKHYQKQLLQKKGK